MGHSGVGVNGPDRETTTPGQAPDGPGPRRRWLEYARQTRLGRSMEGEGLRARAMRGSGISLVGMGVQQGLRLASSLVLTRLLFPEAYGVMGIAYVFMNGLQMFSDLGIRPAIIHNKRGHDPEFLNTAWTMAVIRGFVLWAVSCAIAYPVSVFYGEPILFPVICVLGATAAIRGFQSTAYATANKKLLLGRLTVLEVVTQVIGIVVTVVWAVFDPSVWALAGGGIIASICAVWMGFVMLPTHRHRLRWDHSAASELVRFGKWIFVSTILGFFANQGDRLILGRYMTMAELGMYVTALHWATLPWMLNSRLGEKVLLAVYSEHQDTAPEKMRPKVARMRWAVCGVLLPVSLVFIVFGHEIIGVLYDPRYADAGWMLQVLSVGFGWAVATNIGPFYLGQGRSKLFMQLVGVKCVLMIVAMLAGGWWLGPVGVVAGVSAGYVAYYPVQVWVYSRFGLWIWKQDLVFLGAIMAAVVWALWGAWP